MSEIHFNALKCGHQLNVVKERDLLAMDFPAVPPVPYAYEDYMGDGIGAVPAEVLRTERDLMPLVPYWSKKLGKDMIISRELSDRGGTLYCELRGDRVKISGKCQLYLSGEITV